MKTHVTLVLDETGSMHSMVDEVITGVNKYVDDMKGDGQDYAFSLLKFDSTHLTWAQRKVKVKDIVRLSRKNYQPGAATPLLDATFRAIKETEQDTKKGQKVMIVVFTDGLENSSREVNATTLTDLIKAKENEGWAFIYLGVAPEAWGNEVHFADTGMAANNLNSAGTTGMAMAMDAASDVRKMYASQVNPDVKHLVPEEVKEKVLNS